MSGFELLSLVALVGVLGAGGCWLAAVWVRQRTRLREAEQAVKRLEQQLEAAKATITARTHLLAIASHDLKGQLGSAIRALETLRPALRNDPSSSGVLRQTQAGLRRLLQFVHRSLDLASIDSGGFRLTLRWCDLGQLVEEEIRSLDTYAEQKQLILVWRPPETAVAVHADPNRIRQVVHNLIDNAIKFTTPAGRIKIVLTTRAGFALVAVHDTGPGLSRADFAGLFRPYQTLSAEPTGGEKSTGLGLHICWEIINRHHGRIDVDTQPGVGSTFTMALPLTAQEPDRDAI